MARYRLGELIRLQASFSNIEGELSDPTAITLNIYKSNVLQDTYAIGDLTHPSTGVYYYDFTPVVAGLYSAEFISSGDPTTVIFQDHIEVSYREDMWPIIDFLRLMTETVEGEVTLDGETYWGDHHLRDMLDGYASRFTVDVLPYSQIDDATYIYLIPRSVSVHLSNLVLWNTLTEAQATGYERLGRQIIFEADQGTTSYRLQGVTYDLNNAAGDVWQAKAALRAKLVQIKAGAHTVYEDQEYKHCLEMAKLYRKQKGIQSVPTRRLGYDIN